MPIKFRCVHCRQFLGISHAMEGAVVDCPTCGRSVRVPFADGRSAPLPKPRLDLADSGLAQALDELGAIGHDDAADVAPSPTIPPATPIPANEPVILPEPVASKPLEPAPPEYDAERLSHFGGSASSGGTSEGGGESGRGLPKDPRAGDIRRDPSAVIIGRFASFAVIGALAGALLIGLGLGFLLGRAGRPMPERDDMGEANGENPQAPGASLPRQGAKLSGRITFQTRDGNRLPDTGAHVLVFPETRRGTVKFPVVGFRPADSAEDFEIARDAFRQAGGVLARVDEKGEYHLDLPDGGEYRVLVISHYQPRSAEPVQMRQDLVALLDTYFDRPASLVGQVRFETGRVRSDGENPMVWDHSFESADH